MEPNHSVGVWARRLEATARTEYQALANERDPEVYFHSLWVLALRQEDAGQLQTAAEIYAEVAAQSPDAQLREKAADHLAAITGKGGSHRTEFFLGQLAKESCSPSALLAMSVAGTAARITRVATLSRLLTTPSSSLLKNQLVAKGLAGAASLAVEAPLFVGANQFARTVFNPGAPTHGNDFGTELKSSFLLLGALRLSAAAGTRLNFVKTLQSPSGKAWLSQGTLFGGILFGHALEKFAGLRSADEGGSLLADSLAMLLQFNIAARVSRGFLGDRFARWERGLDARGEALFQGPRTPSLPSWLNPLLIDGSSAPHSNRAKAEIAPNSMAMIIIEKPERPGSVFGPRMPPQVKDRAHIDYPPEIDALLGKIEAIIRQPGHLKGSRAELRKKNPPAEWLDRLWYFQNMDLFRRIPWVEVRTRTVDSLLEPLYFEELQPAPDPEFLQRALKLLEKRRRVTPESTQVLEIRFPHERLVTLLDYPEFTPEHGLLYISTLFEAQEKLKHQVHLLSRDGPYLVARLTTWGLLEALYQSAFGEKAVQFHYVDGEIPRDDTENLRRRRATPVGITRHQTALGDTGKHIHPAGYTAHDAAFHGAIDAATVPEYRAFNGRFYQFLMQAKGLNPYRRESMLNRISDGDFGNKNEFFTADFGREATILLEEALANAQKETRPFQRRRGFRKLRELVVELGALSANPWETLEKKQPYQDDYQRFQDVSRQIIRFHSSPRVYYPGEMQGVVAQIERGKQQPGYLEGTREELLAKRVDIRLADRLWHHTALDFAGRIPHVKVRQLDAESLMQSLAPHDTPVETAVIRESLRKLQERNPRDSSYRQVLEFQFPMKMWSLHEYFIKDPSLRYLSGMPLVTLTQEQLAHRVHLYGGDGNWIRLRIPSLSLLESILQQLYGEERTQFHFVPGEIPMDDTMSIRSRSANVISLSSFGHFFSEFGGTIHPFSFTGHDALEHASREARIAPALRAFAGRFYFAARDFFPNSPRKEKLLIEVSDLHQLEDKTPAAAAAYWVGNRLSVPLSVRQGTTAYLEQLDESKKFMETALEFSERKLPELNDPGFRDPLFKKYRQLKDGFSDEE